MASETMMEAWTNLRVLRPSRKPPRPGDIFVLKPDDYRYVFGRVIRTEVNVGGFPGGILIYIYGPTSSRKDRVPALDRDDLLLPPLATNRLPWVRGYFQTIATSPLKDSDILAVHCFRSSSGDYFDEMGNPLRGPIGRVGEFALQSYRSVDDLVSDALDIPKVPFMHRRPLRGGPDGRID
jgi:hypothetical protein